MAELTVILYKSEKISRDVNGSLKREMTKKP